LWRIYKASDTDHIGAINPAFRLVVNRAAISGPSLPVLLDTE
jgi:hypothetical protein